VSHDIEEPISAEGVTALRKISAKQLVTMAFRAAASTGFRSILTSGSCRVKTAFSSSSRLTFSNIPSRSVSTDKTQDDDDTVTITIDEARSTTAKALRMIGWDEQDAALQAEIMTAAELCGNNQGLVKMYQPTMMQPAPNSGKPFIERSTSNSAVLNANQAPGMLAAVMGADKAIELCQQQPKSTIAVVCTHNTSTSSGQLAFYAERIARSGLIGICLANSPEMVAAAQGGKAVFGTNPLAIGVPQANSYPFTVSAEHHCYFEYIVQPSHSQSPHSLSL
jgi:Malate/L-lactate dehydrogenase